MIVDPASPFVTAWLPRLFARLGGSPRALDLAMGRGRHSVAAADVGFRTFGVDLKVEAVCDAVRSATARALQIRVWCADLTTYPLPREAFELVLVSRYLQRDLFPAIAEAVVPGGFVVYETFTVRQRLLGNGPKSPDHLLEVGELRARFDGFLVMSYEEVSESEALARIVAQRTRRS